MKVKNKLMKSGMMILSGLLLPDKEPIGQRLNALGFEVCEELIENEWIAFVAHLLTIDRNSTHCSFN